VPRCIRGYFLDTRFLKPLGITQQALATSLGISRRRVNELIRGHRGITADTAVRLARTSQRGDVLDAAAVRLGPARSRQRLKF